VKRPALLADATWYGTLAAARDLGRRGVPVTLGCDAATAPARWSRYVSRVVRCPSTREHGAFAGWLRAFGARHPPHVLYPTSDDAAWVLAAHREELQGRFLLYSPAPDALATLLDKHRLATAAAAAGLDAAECWLARDEDDVARIADEVPFPLFVKPRAQLAASGGFKGTRVDRREDLLPVWQQARQSVRVPADLPPGLAAPLILRCYPASETILTVDGFLARGGGAAMRACHKVLQHPRRLGPGIVFEDAPLPATLACGLERLLRQASYFGVFDAEFVRDGARWRLIDMNPRFYNHMAFEIDRGLPLPWLAYLGALEEEDALAAALAEARRAAPRSAAFVHHLPATLMLAAQGLAGHMSAAERRGWRAWMRARRHAVTDPARSAGDFWPWAADAVFHAARLLRHPRAFLRGLARPPRGGAG
jgi:predicted ATP-grasp superfamily ATP-dependent carboligase